MKKINIILGILAVALVVGLTLKGASVYYGNIIDKYQEETKASKIRESKLEKLNEELYTKLVADSASTRELKKLNDSLQLKLDNPKVITVVKWKYKEVEKPVEDVEVKDSTLTFTDYYPTKQNPFITYTGKFKLYDKVGFGKFNFKPQELRLGISQNEDGTYSVNSGVPSYVQITGLDVVALPMEPPKVDNFGWIVGGRIGQDILSTSNYIKINGGIRYKKFYLSVGAATNGTAEAGIDIEL